MSNRWGEAIESSSRFATYVAFGLFSPVILVFTIGHAFFIIAISYLAEALKTVDIFLDYFFGNSRTLGAFLADAFPTIKPTRRFPSWVFFDPGAVTDA